MKKATVSDGPFHNGFAEPLISLHNKGYQIMSQSDKQCVIEEIESVNAAAMGVNLAFSKDHVCYYCAPDNSAA